MFDTNLRHKKTSRMSILLPLSLDRMMGDQRPTRFTAASLVNKVLLPQSTISFIASVRSHHEQITNKQRT